MSTEPDIQWTGESGTKYGYWIHSINTTFSESPANYIFAKVTEPNTWEPIYIGQTGNIAERLEDQYKKECIQRNGATHIHIHKSSSSEEKRKTEETDLINNYHPVCND